jgi:hypothetical protein
MAKYPVKIALEFTEEEINTIRPFFYIVDDIETQLTNFIWETIYEKTSKATKIVYPISIYKDTTGQYTDDECDIDNCVDIPVPEDLLIQWFMDENCWNRQVSAEILEDLRKWVYEESTCDETCDLYRWLCGHGYHWKRLRKEDE